MASITGITVHSQLLSFTAPTLAGVRDQANAAITTAENAATDNQIVEVAFTDAIWDGSSWSIVITIKTSTNNYLSLTT